MLLLEQKNISECTNKKYPTSDEKFTFSYLYKVRLIIIYLRLSLILHSFHLYYFATKYHKYLSESPKIIKYDIESLSWRVMDKRLANQLKAF